MRHPDCNAGLLNVAEGLNNLAREIHEFRVAPHCELSPQERASLINRLILADAASERLERLRRF